MITLKPCPFCGGEASIWKNGGKYGPFCYVECDVCGARTKARKVHPMDEYDSPEEFLEQPGFITVCNAWNTRRRGKKKSGD